MESLATREFGSQSYVSLALIKALSPGLNIKNLLIEELSLSVESQGYALSNEPVCSIEGYFKVSEDGMLRVPEQEADVVSYWVRASI